MQPLPSGDILDVGCGDGERLLKLECTPQVRRFGLDISSTAIARAKTRAGNSESSNFTVGDAGSLPFKDNHFHRVLCCYLIEHVPNPERLIQEVYRVLEPGGRFICFTPNASRAYNQPGLNRIFALIFYPISALLALITAPFTNRNLSPLKVIRFTAEAAKKTQRINQKFGIEEHLHEFNLSELQASAEKAGLEIKDSGFIGFHGGIGPIASALLYSNNEFGKAWNGLSVLLELRAPKWLRKMLLVDFYIVGRKARWERQ